jgi:MtN3 and saliva related transmembrane protein
MTEIVGWASSVILLMTLIKQVYKQWKERTSEGVSKWLFVGQLAASIGFTIYSYLTGNVVFIVTNIILTVNNIIGTILYFYFARAGENSSGDRAAPPQDRLANAE